MTTAERPTRTATPAAPAPRGASADATEVSGGARLPEPDDGLPGLRVVGAPEPALLGTFHPLAGREVVVGRGAEATLRIDDGGLSRRHLRVAAGPNGEVVAHDLGSTNGTFVNGVKVRSAVLAPGDCIRLGTGTQLLYGAPGQVGAEEVRLRLTLAALGVGAWHWERFTDQLTFTGGAVAQPGDVLAITEPRPDEGWSRVHEDDRGPLRARLHGLGAPGERVELELRLLRGGEQRWIALRGEAFADAAGRVVRASGTAADVTDRRCAEEELRRQSLLLDSLSDGVMALGLDGAILEWNARAAEMLGWTRAEVLGRRPGAFLAPGREDLGAAVLARTAAGERLVEERRLRCRDGRELAVEVAAVPLVDPGGRRTAAVAILRDVDERRRLLARLQVSERLAALGTLATGVAHEINNPLAFVTSNLFWVKEQLAEHGAALGPAWPEIAAAVSDCQEGAGRIGAIVQDLRTHATAPRPGEEEPTDPVAALEFTLRVADGELRHRARVVRDLRPVPAVRATRAGLGQVFLNVLLNAAQAIAPGRPDDNQVVVTTRHDLAADRVVVEIRDTGAGMDPDTASRIFDPFFTTRQVGSGTGLGLFVCHGIVTSLGGQIEVDSQPGQGTTFRISLPVARVPREEAPPGRARILVVDDEPLFCAMAGRLLGRRHEVVTCTDPREALREVERGARFDALVLDAAMPGMGGLQLLARLDAVAPRLAARAVILSAGGLDDAARLELQRRGVAHLAKPLELEVLGTHIEALLAQPAR